MASQVSSTAPTRIGRTARGSSSAARDRHQFRFIVSVEDGVDGDDLKPFIIRRRWRRWRRTSARGSIARSTTNNTGHPHSHVTCAAGPPNKDLIIAREYITEGMRERAAEIVRLDLGPRSDFEIEDRLRDEVESGALH